METKVEVVDSKSNCLAACCCTRSDCLDASSSQTSASLLQQLSQAKRRVTLLASITCVFCLLSVGACAGSVVIYYKIQTGDLSFSGQHTTEDNQNLHGQTKGDIPPVTAAMLGVEAEEDKVDELLKLVKEHFSSMGKDRKQNELPQSGPDDSQAREEKRDACPPHCVSSSVSPDPVQNPTPASSISGRCHRCPGLIMTAHYSSYVNHDYVKSKFGELDHGNLQDTVRCKYIPDWHGHVCRNRTFFSDDAPLTLNVFKPASWMNNGNDVNIPFEQMEDGTFLVKRTGLYLLHAHVQFFSSAEQSLSIDHLSSTGKGMKHTMRGHLTSGQGHHVTLHQNFRTCTVTGAVFMKTDEKVRIVLLNRTEEMDLRHDQSYFTAFLLRPINH